NDAPVAHDDSYTLTHDTPLTVAAAGVLSNDSDLEGNPLSALLVNGPAHGSLALNANGALTYTPAANFSGTDSFTYKANDGQTVNGDGSYGYVASKLPLPSQAVAQDHFSYTANDGHGGTSTAALTVTITSPGTDYRAGTDGNDTLIAGSGQSVLDGGNGNDVL